MRNIRKIPLNFVLFLIGLVVILQTQIQAEYKKIDINNLNIKGSFRFDTKSNYYYYLPITEPPNLIINFANIEQPKILNFVYLEDSYKDYKKKIEIFYLDNKGDWQKIKKYKIAIDNQKINIEFNKQFATQSLKIEFLKKTKIVLNDIQISVFDIKTKIKIIKASIENITENSAELKVVADTIARLKIDYKSVKDDNFYRNVVIDTQSTQFNFKFEQLKDNTEYNYKISVERTNDDSVETTGIFKTASKKKLEILNSKIDTANDTAVIHFQFTVDVKYSIQIKESDNTIIYSLNSKNYNNEINLFLNNLRSNTDYYLDLKIYDANNNTVNHKTSFKTK